MFAFFHMFCLVKNSQISRTLRAVPVEEADQGLTVSFVDRTVILRAPYCRYIEVNTDYT